jgi:hypothetical protein
MTPPINNEENSSNTNGNGSNGSWVAYQKLVLSEIERLDKNSTLLFSKIDELDTTLHKELGDIAFEIRKEMGTAISDLKSLITTIDKNLAILETKAAFYGAIGGAIFTGIIEFIVYMMAGKKG